MRLPRHVTEATAAPGSSPRVDHDTGEVHEDIPDAAHPPVEAVPDDTHPDERQGTEDSLAAMLTPADEQPDHPVGLDAA
ncbi:hypothetical protein [Curtobacterium sp. MCPF17_052]|nr:hypothetical protein [Curtobacterium sp. MCPF17_052]WIB12115.1 hypothetical protein DEJ36_15260 [Curtobacterium sp. MCPF17_052]